MHLVCKISAVVKLDCCILIHSQTTIPTSSLLEDRPLSKLCFSCSSSRTDVQNFLVKWLQYVLCPPSCLELHYCAESLHLAIELLFVLRRSTCDVTESTRMRKWQWLFVNFCPYKIRTSVVTKFVNSCQDDLIALMCSEIILKIMLLRCKTLIAINAAVTSHLIFIT
jgi:hypothetical protein